MMGRKAGVATELKKLFPTLLIWYCSNHRLELAISDTRNEVHGVNHFQMFLINYFHCITFLLEIKES